MLKSAEANGNGADDAMLPSFDYKLVESVFTPYCSPLRGLGSS